MRKVLWAGLTLLLAGCASALVPDQVSFGNQQMQRQLEKRFPLEKQYIGLVDLTLNHPQVGTNVAQQRVTLQLDTRMQVLGMDHTVTGHFVASGQLGYDSPSQTIRLRHPQLDDASILGLSADTTRLLRKVSGILLAEKLDGAVLYHFTADDLKILGMHIEPDRIEVVADGVVIHLVKSKPTF